VTDVTAALALVFRVGARRCALPLGAVVETLRPLPAEPLPGAPPFVRGVAIVRGEPVPVVDAARLLGEPAGLLARWITLDLGQRHVALAVDEVLGVRALSGAAHALPPLLADEGASGVAALGRLDGALLHVLDGARLVPEAAWVALEATRA